MKSATTLDPHDALADEIVRLSIDEECSIREIVAETGINTSAVTRILRLRGASPHLLLRIVDQKSRTPLTHQEFYRVRSVRLTHDCSSAEAAEELQLPPIEVNAAYAYSTYERYLAYR